MDTGTWLISEGIRGIYTFVYIHVMGTGWKIGGEGFNITEVAIMYMVFISEEMRDGDLIGKKGLNNHTNIFQIDRFLFITK